jgi:hypothetical protein
VPSFMLPPGLELTRRYGGKAPARNWANTAAR